MSTDAPIFVCGPQRSGTTLLARMLGAHPRLCIENEIPNPVQTLANVCSAEEFASQVDAHEKMFRQFKSLGKVRWGLKDPALVHCLPRLSYLFSDSPIIMLVRDGRAVANSHLKTRFGVVNNIYAAGMTWRNEVNLQHEFTMQSSAAILVKYEDLVRHPRRELARICLHIGEEFDDRMLQYEREETFIKRNGFNENTFNQLDESVIDKRKCELSRYQVNVLESMVGIELRRHGYELAGRRIWIPTALKWCYAAHQWVMREYRWQKLKWSRRRTSVGTMK